MSADNVTDSEYNHSSSNSGEKTDTTNTREGSKTDKQLFSVFGFAMNIALWFLARKLSISFRFLDAAYSRLPDCIVTMICFILAILLCFALLFIVLECGGLVYEALLEKNIRKAVLIVLADIVCIFIWEPTTRK